MVAWSYGYASTWAALKHFVDGVTVARFLRGSQGGDVSLLQQMLQARA